MIEYRSRRILTIGGRRRVQPWTSRHDASIWMTAWKQIHPDALPPGTQALLDALEAAKRHVADSPVLQVTLTYDWPRQTDQYRVSADPTPSGAQS